MPMTAQLPREDPWPQAMGCISSREHSGAGTLWYENCFFMPPFNPYTHRIAGP